MQGWLEVAEQNGAEILEETPELIAAEVAFILSWKAEEGWPLVVETMEIALPAAVAA